MTILILGAVSIIIFFAIKWFAYFAVDVKGWIPDFIKYKPYSCSFCLAFWTNLLVTTLLSFLHLGFLFGYLLVVLDTVAYWVDRKNNTINLED